METTRSLPAREPALPGESLASVLRRTAAGMGYDGPGQIRQLLSTVGKVPWNVNHIGPGLLTDYLAVLLRTSPEDVSVLTVHRFAKRLVLSARTASHADTCDFKTTLRYFTPTPAVCPTCLCEDSVPYERLDWSLLPLGFCTRHLCFLITKCHHCGRSLWQDRADVTRCRCGVDVRGVAPSSVPGDARSPVSLLNDLFCSPNPSVLGMAPPSCVWWAERLAAAVAKTQAWIHDLQESRALPEKLPVHVMAWLAAADILSHWPQRFERFLDAFQRRVLEGHVHPAGDCGRRMGLVSRESLDILKRELADALSITDVATCLELGRSGVLALIHESVLPRAVRTIRGWRIPRQSVETFERICRDARTAKGPGQQWISLREATRRYGPSGLNLPALLRLMLRKDVRVRMFEPERVLHGLVVHRTELETLLPNVRSDRDPGAGYPLSRAAKVILPGRPLKPIVLLLPARSADPRHLQLRQRLCPA